jgi:hypothetical protein
LGLYNCGNKSQSKVVNTYHRGSARYTLSCGYSKKTKKKGAFGIRHIQEDNKHFGGNVSGVVRNQLIRQTIASGKEEDPEDQRGPTVAYDKTFVAVGVDLPPETNAFSIKVVVNRETGQVVTAYAPDDADVDQNQLDNCHWGGVTSCGNGNINFEVPF